MPLAPRLALLLLLLLTAGRAAAAPDALDAWADGVCPPAEGTPRRRCLEDALLALLERQQAQLAQARAEAEAKRRDEAGPLAARLREALAAAQAAPAPGHASREAEVAQLRESLAAVQLRAERAGVLQDRWELLQQDWREWTNDACLLALRGWEYDLRTGDTRAGQPPEGVTQPRCMQGLVSWRGAVAAAVLAGDAGRVASALAALEARALRAGGTKAPEDLPGTAHAVAVRALARTTPAPERLTAGGWRVFLGRVAVSAPRPQRLAWLECQLLRERGVTAPPRCEDRLRAVLWAQLAPLPERLAEAARMAAPPAERVRAAEAALSRPAPEPELPNEPWALQDPLPALLSQVEPRLPDAARASQAQGFHLARCSLAGDGTLRSCRTVLGVPGADAAVVEALHQWRFAPGAVRPRVFVSLPIRSRPE